jgi:RNA recognition motif-containing protein
VIEQLRMRYGLYLTHLELYIVFNVAYDKYSGRSKGFAFVEMPDDSNAGLAIQELNNSVVDGQKIVVYEARPKPERPENNRFSRSGPRPGFRPRY